MVKIIHSPTAPGKEIGDLYQNATGVWYQYNGVTWDTYHQPIPGEVADEYKATGKTLDYQHGCGYQNITAKHPCGGCSAMPWLNVPAEKKVGDIGYCQHCGYTGNYTPLEACGSCGEYPWHTVPKAKVEIADTENTFTVALNLKESNSAPTTFMKHEGKVLVDPMVLKSCAENLDRLREARNTYRKQYQEMAGAMSPKGKRNARAGQLFRQFEAWNNKRKTIADGNDDGTAPTKAQVAQRKRRSDEASAKLLKEYASLLGFVSIEELLSDADD